MQKQSTRLIVAGGALLAALAGGLHLAQAGNLTPPAGPVQATGPVLLNAQDISLPYTIMASGHYRLTSDLEAPVNSDGVIIDANDVVLDLNGFGIRSAGGAAGRGVYINPGRVGAEVKCGTIGGFPLGAIAGQDAMCTKVSGISAVANGAAGIAVGDDSEVRDSTATDNVGAGISAGARGAIENIKAKNNGGAGIAVGNGARVVGGNASGNGGAGISAGDGARIAGARVSGNVGDGVSTGGGSIVKDVTSEGNGGAGVRTGAGAAVGGAIANGNGGDGINVGDGSEVDDSSACDNTGVGIRAGLAGKVSGAVAKGNMGGGVSAVGGAVAGSSASENDGQGFAGFGETSFHGCSASGNIGPGFILDGSGGSVIDSTASGNHGHGIVTGAGGLIRGNTCGGNVNPGDPAAGIRIRFAGNRIDSNTCTGNEYGIGRDEEADAFNIILRNTGSANLILNFDLGGNTHGPIVNVIGVGDIQLTPLADHPWANFEY